MRPLLVGSLVLLIASIVMGNEELGIDFINEKCYGSELNRVDDRMPLSINDLTALIEKYERQYTISIQNMAQGLLNRYQKNGIIYKEDGLDHKWASIEDEEITKSNNLKKVNPSDFNIQKDVFDEREECALHFMTSHATDLYNHPETRNFWDSSTFRRRRRRSIGSSERTNVRSVDYNDRAEHPIESGIIHTSWGPISGGTLLRGMAAFESSSSSSTLDRILNGDTDYMPSEMKSLSFKDLVFVNTLAGDIAQTAIPNVNTLGGADSQVGSEGRFYPHTACPRMFLLESITDTGKQIPLITRAEIFGAIDAILIWTGLGNERNSDYKFSDILRMYYSDTGLPGRQDYKACNRIELFKNIDKDIIKEQARIFMYLLSSEDEQLKDLIKEHIDDFSTLESKYKRTVDDVWKAVEQFINNEAMSYPSCSGSSSSNDVHPENVVDLVVVMGSQSDRLTQQQYIAHLATKLGVRYDGSRLAIIDGRNGQWLMGMSNISNIADWACNFTVDNNVGGSSFNLQEVFKTLQGYYTDHETSLFEDESSYGANSQVLLWSSPKTGGDMEIFKEDFEDFKTLHPEVTMLVVSRTKTDFDFMVDDTDDDYFSEPSGKDSDDIEEFAEELEKRIRKAPAMFVYPACLTNDSRFDSYNEVNHRYTGYVSPNHTVYLKIGAKTFHFSREVTLDFTGSDLRYCASRENHFPKESDSDVICYNDDEDFVFNHPCGRYLEECDSIYISVTSKAEGTTARCNDDECLFPNQHKFEMKHDGIKCGTSGLVPLPLVLLLSIIFVLRQ